MTITGRMGVRFRVDFGRHCSIGIGKIELLEAIRATGSLSEAARRMGMSYRRAWLLFADLNASFDEPVAHASTGGRGGGGAVLSPVGERLIASYRRMEAELPALAQAHLQEFDRRARRPASSTRPNNAVPTVSVKGRVLPVRGATRRKAPGGAAPAGSGGAKRT